MGAYLLRRLGEVLPVLLVVATAAFLLVKVVPGSPFDTDRPMPAEIKARYEAHYGLDQPTHVQFGRYLASLARGDLGLSTKYHGWTVNELVAPRIPVSLQLGLLALALACAVGIPVGVLAAARPDSWLDRIPMGFSLLGICLPSFVIGPVLSLILSRWLGLVPPCGWGGPEHLALPVLTLGIVVAAPIARLTRGAMLEVRASDFVRTAQAKGLGPFRVWFVHTLRNALLPVVTYLAPAAAGLVSGSFVVESMFDVPGLGRLFVTSVTNRDATLIVGLTLLYASALLVLNLLADLGLAWLNPRLKRGRAEAGGLTPGYLAGLLLAPLALLGLHALLAPAKAWAQASGLWAILSGDGARLAVGLLVGLAGLAVLVLVLRALAQGWSRFRRNRPAMVAGVFLLLVGAACLGAAQGWLPLADYRAQNLALGPVAPGADHPLGTDTLGRDLLSRLLHGGSVSLLVGLIATVIALVFGTAYGIAAGQARGGVGEAMMRVVDVINTLPLTLIIILCTVVFGQDLWLLYVVVGGISWLTMARVVRNQVLALRATPFVQAAETMGASTGRIVLRHYLPNLAGTLAIYGTLTVPGVMLLEAFVSFLGLGVQAPMTSWGLLIKEGADVMEECPWILLAPSTLFALTLLALNFVGDGLRDAFDPRDTRR